MREKMCCRKTTKCICFCALLAAVLLALSAHAAVDRPAFIEASGESAIFDVKAAADGTLRVGTKAGQVGDRWRVTIVQANKAGAVSAVGNGRDNAFSGFASLAVVADLRYLVLVTLDRPLQGAFPADVTVRFTGSTGATDPPVVQLNGKPLADITPRPISWREQSSTCPRDGAVLSCEALLACELSPGGDTDLFKVTVPANSVLSINVAGPNWTHWKIFDPDGNPINPSGCYGQCEVALPTAGTYAIQISNSMDAHGPYVLSLLGVAATSSFRCGPNVFPDGNPKTGNFDLSGDTDSFQLNNVLANETYSINIAGPNWTNWRIFDPDGNPIDPNGCYDQCEVTPQTSGNYTIVVSNDLSFSGEYTLSVQKVGG